MKVIQNTRRSACFINRLAVVIFFSLQAKMAMAEKTIQNPDSAERIMTVAKVYEEKNSEPGSIQVTFYESARFYKLLKSNPHWKEFAGILKEAVKKRKPVAVRLGGPDGDIIERVRWGK